MSWTEALADDRQMLQSMRDPRTPMAMYGDDVVVFAASAHVLLDRSTETVVVGTTEIEAYLALHQIDPFNGWSIERRD